MEVAVVGLGGTGAAAARALAERGHRVTAFEGEQPGHGRGSSHGESRIIRHAYEDATYAQLMVRAWPAWVELDRRAGGDLLVACGGLTIGPAGHAAVRAVVASLEAVGAPHDVLEPPAARALFPALAIADGEVAVLESRAGFLRATRCVLAQARMAREAGAQLVAGCRVSGIDRAGTGVRVALADGASRVFDRVVVAAGAWTGRLVPALASRLRVTRQQWVYLRHDGAAAEVAPARLPVWIDVATHDYGFPSDGVVPGLKVASHVHGPVIDPDEPGREARLERERELVERARRRIPSLADEVTSASACLYTNAPGDDFVLGRVPGIDGAVVVSGCSGHGFKFTNLLGELAADLAEDRPLPTECATFAPG